VGISEYLLILSLYESDNSVLVEIAYISLLHSYLEEPL
jgi:hypothetical protein